MWHGFWCSHISIRGRCSTRVGAAEVPTITAGAAVKQYQCAELSSTHQPHSMSQQLLSQGVSISAELACARAGPHRLAPNCHNNTFSQLTPPRRRFCYSNLTRTRPICVSDEHMLPTLLASYGLDNQTDCLGLAHWADWSRPGWHPHAFGGLDVLDGALVARMRAAAKTAAVAAAAIVRGEERGLYGQCGVDAALGSARVLVGRGRRGELVGAGEGDEDDDALLVDDDQGGSFVADKGTGLAGASADASGAAVGSAGGEGAVLPSSLPFGYQTRRAQQQALQPAPAGFLQRLVAFLGTKVGPPQLPGGWSASGRARQASQPGRAGTAAGQHGQKGATAAGGAVPAQQQQDTAAQEAATGSAGGMDLPRGAADVGSDHQAQQNHQNQQQEDAPSAPYPQRLADWAQNQLRYQPLGPHCSLLARKFTAAALPGSLHMALSCGGLGLGSWCQHNQPLHDAAGVDAE